MTDTNWFRQESWGNEIAANFEARLSKTRGQRGEYLRIQALTLVATCNVKFAAPAIELAQRHLVLQPTGISAAQMHATIGKACEMLDDKLAALNSYRRAVELEHARPNVRGYHYLDFAWFVVANAMTSVYEEVLSAIAGNKEDRDLIFPANQFRYFAALAFISDDTGDAPNAKRMAELALEAESTKTGPCKRFPSLGIFKSKKDAFQRRLEQLAR